MLGADKPMVTPLIYRLHVRHFKNKTETLQDRKTFTALSGSIQCLLHYLQA